MLLHSLVALSLPFALSASDGAPAASSLHAPSGRSAVAAADFPGFPNPFRR